MGIFKWLKKATKVIGKMAVEAAEEDERSKFGYELDITDIEGKWILSTLVRMQGY